MARQALIDAPGALHHIICRGIERRKTYDDDAERHHFLKRFGNILKESSTPCYRWTLIPNHFNLLLRTGKVPNSTVLWSVESRLTGDAVRELGMSQTNLSRLLGNGQSALSRAVVRGKN